MAASGAILEPTGPVVSLEWKRLRFTLLSLPRIFVRNVLLLLI